ncbi:hypothetical protein PoB_001528900 [Plakobranchus ocellatus]|uniref:Uncharacterized protein n=1 Tax=Plakobranchus ocellatus TaxID=259542 RepID=A0AAV3Z0D4_9GAST|nr:hypothetical protein PoB_001528900 [Plakobranchus ocellatus]
MDEDQSADEAAVASCRTTREANIDSCIDRNSFSEAPSDLPNGFHEENPLNQWGVGGTVASESALRSAGTLLSRVRAPPPASWPVEGLKA